MWDCMKYQGRAKCGIVWHGKLKQSRALHGVARCSKLFAPAQLFSIAENARARHKSLRVGIKRNGHTYVRRERRTDPLTE